MMETDEGRKKKQHIHNRMMDGIIKRNNNVTIRGWRGDRKKSLLLLVEYAVDSLLKKQLDVVAQQLAEQTPCALPLIDPDFFSLSLSSPSHILAGIQLQHRRSYYIPLHPCP